MPDCCKPEYDTVFSEKRARKDVKRYRKKGADKTTRLLIDALTTAGVEGQTLLDIGGGIGVIPNELLSAGVASAVHVEASEAFVRAAAEEAARRGNHDRVRFERGDFVALSPGIAPADIVTLDRVICCYANMEQLVSSSASRARRLYGVVIPRQRRLTRIMRLGINAIFRITRNAFRFHVHSPNEIERLIRASGLELRSLTETAIWRVTVYERNPGRARAVSAPGALGSPRL